MSNLSCIASVSIAKDTYIARLQQRMPVAIQALAATVATFTNSSGTTTRRAAAKRSLNTLQGYHIFAFGYVCM